jgi:putative transposase
LCHPAAGLRGGSDDKALVETINGLYKAEVIHPSRPWRSVDDVDFATLSWVHGFDNRRLREPIKQAAGGA